MANIKGGEGEGGGGKFEAPKVELTEATEAATKGSTEAFDIPKSKTESTEAKAEKPAAEKNVDKAEGIGEKKEAEVSKLSTPEQTAKWGATRVENEILKKQSTGDVAGENAVKEMSKDYGQSNLDAQASKEAMWKRQGMSDGDIAAKRAINNQAAQHWDKVFNK